MPRARSQLLGGFALAMLLSGCDVGTPAQDDATRNIDAPPLNIVDVQATVAYRAKDEGTTPLVPVRASMLDGELADVTATATVVIEVDRLLLPASVQGSVCVSLGTSPVASAAECSAAMKPNQSLHYDPARRRLVVYLEGGNTFRPEAEYTVTVLAPSESTPGLTAFDGAPLAASASFVFRTQPEGGVTFEERAPGVDRYCDAVRGVTSCAETRAACREPCVTERDTCEEPCNAEQDTCEEPCNGLSGADLVACAGPCEEAGDACRDDCTPAFDACVAPCDEALPGCRAEVSCLDDDFDYAGGDTARCNLGLHSAGLGVFGACTSGGLCHGAALPPELGSAMGLNLADAPAYEATARGAVAHQTQQGELGAVPDPAPLRFGRAMPIVSPGDPGNSYALYKVFAKPGNHATVDESLRAEIERLRASVVTGVPMPPGVNFSAGDQGLTQISAWIAHGAVTSCD